MFATQTALQAHPQAHADIRLAPSPKAETAFTPNKCWSDVGPSEVVLERQRWADAPMNDGDHSFDGTFNATLTGCAGVVRGLTNENSDHYHYQSRPSRLPSGCCGSCLSSDVN